MLINGLVFQLEQVSPSLLEHLLSFFIWLILHHLVGHLGLHGRLGHLRRLIHVWFLLVGLLLHVGTVVWLVFLNSRVNLFCVFWNVLIRNLLPAVLPVCPIPVIVPSLVVLSALLLVRVWHSALGNGWISSLLVVHRLLLSRVVYALRTNALQWVWHSLIGVVRRLLAEGSDPLLRLIRVLILVRSIAIATVLHHLLGWIVEKITS